MRSPGLSAVHWRRSSYSNTTGGECLEVAGGLPRSVPVRDSKMPGSGLVVSAGAWRAFIRAVVRPDELAT
ncbi:DUF397 domain-containing protein [Streptomyces johnsoniae]|uniref:DUF397 domain-containing protein n=1 Tax=Streptomyces johnsoniae TaxID=3075532 RepID=A0ABU2S7B7_9ACTN|nr:DUF397 domain-containing protein [Streptomyces sp. DSM 41886]MDT0444005.1 DUF397 domain-containing protein [Streptomyces sp. DSM 41886]